MNIIILISCIATSSLIFSMPVLAEQKIELNIYQVMQRVLDRYPLLKTSELEVAQAAELKQQVESSLGWQLNSSAGVTHDLTGFGTPSDRMDINSAVGRQLKSGSTISLSGGYRYEDSSLSISPVLPNPAHTTRLDLSYRLPLSQGEGNPLYSEGLITAESSHKLAIAKQLSTRITLAEQVKNIFYASAATKARMDNAKQAVKRAKKLELYIDKNVRLGLSEKKDKLQVVAQYNSKLSDLSAIRIQWEQQQNSLNRLMLEGIGKNVYPSLISHESYNSYALQDLIELAKAYHPAIKTSQEQLLIAESKINSANDKKKDNLDLVMSVGSRTSDGTSKSGTVSEKDWAGSITLEYKHLFDDNGVTSKYRQAQIEKNIALENIVKVNDDIRYTTSGLVAEIKAAKLAVKSANKKLQSELLKLKEAEHRFRTGRANTAQLIQFQNEYSFAELSYQNQKIDFNSRIIALQIFSGQFWDKLTLVDLPSAQHGVKK